MFMKNILNLCCIGLLAIMGSQSALAGECKQNIQVSNPWDALSNDSWQSGCESVNRTDTSDPYNPTPALAKYYTFTLERDADIRMQLDPSYSDYYGSFNLIEGASEYGTVLSSHQSGDFETRLTAGTYTLEMTHIYGASFTYKVAFNDTALNNQCVQAISTGTPISDGWISACESTNRDMVDPYNIIPGEGHRTKYFTFSLQDHTDIRIEVDATVNTYIYILSGTGEHAVPYEEFNDEAVTTSLPQGDYTIELTTYDRYAPGQFEIKLSAYTNTEGCSQELTLGSIVAGSWSADCEIRSWLDENGDPYQGEGPERANYYSFTLTEAKELRFSLSGQNDNKTIFSLYEAGDYLNKLASTQSNYSWGSPASEFSIHLEPGSYELEVTKYNELAIGNYTISSFVFENDGCTNAIQLGATEEAYIASGCQSLFRIVDGGMDDPYGVQPGTYYAKRFEFTLEDPTSVLMSANTYSQSGYLYLAKRINGQWQRLTETWPENSWSTTSSPSIHRTLDAGTYALEVTSYYPEREGQITASVRASSASTCGTYLTLNTRTLGTLGSNGSCRSEFKSSEYNYDPYGPNNGYQHYYAKYYTFEIEQAGNYNIVGSAQSFATHLYLVQGGDVKGQQITDQVNGGENSISQYLETGIYTIEVTSLTASGVGSYSILVWDGSSEIEDSAGTNECIQTLSSEETNFTLLGTWTADCESESRSGRYAKYFNFTIPEGLQAGIELELASSIYSYLYLLEWSGESWSAIDSDLGYPTTANINRTSLPAGTYRIEATTYYYAAQAEFQLLVNINYADTDGDGVFDNNDAFPNDNSEWLDSDGDSVGDNADVFPENASEWYDTDHDGIGNNADIDDDNDGVFDYLDALPLDSEAYLDSDFDGISDELDEFPYPYAGDIRFVVKSVQVMESESKAVVTIERVGDPFLDASIFYYTEDESAVANVDYIPSSGKLEFGAYVDTHTIEIDMINDDTYSGDRSFFIKLSFSSVFVSNSQGVIAQVVIEDDELTPIAGVIDFSASTVFVNETESEVQVEIIRSENALGEAVVAVSTLDNTAKASSDYEAISELLVFAEGEISKIVSIPLIDNSEFESEESFSIGLTLMSADTVSSLRVIEVFISDDDALPVAGEFSLVIKSMVIPEEEGEIVFALQRTPDSIGEVLINWSAKNNMQLQGLELASDSGSVLFEDGETYMSISLYLLKGAEQFSGLSQELCITLSLDTGEAHLSDKEFCITLLESDLPPETGYITFSGPSYKTSEGSPATITVNRLFSSTESQDVFVNFKTEANEAEIELDFVGLYTDIGILSQEVTQFVTVETINDELVEGEESFTVIMSTSGETKTVPVYIVDNESGFSVNGAFRFSGDDYTVNEDESTVSVVIQRVFGFEGEATLMLETVDISAESGMDYQGDTQHLTFDHGEKSKVVELSIYGDSESFDDKSFSIALSSDTNTVLLTPNKALITINNVDIAKKISSKKGDGILGLGLWSPWWLLMFLMPISLIRVNRVEV